MSLHKLKSIQGGFVKTSTKLKNNDLADTKEHNKKKNKHFKEKRKYIDDFEDTYFTDDSYDK
jgi:hypothetical protein